MDVRVLLVDDEIELRELWGEVLEARGYDVVGARSVQEVRELVANGARFDIAVVDWTLPDGTGGDVLAALPSEPPMPVVFASGLGPLLPAGHGGDAVLAKPFRTRDLMATVERLLTR